MGWHLEVQPLGGDPTSGIGVPVKEACRPLHPPTTRGRPEETAVHDPGTGFHQRQVCRRLDLRLPSLHNCEK